MNLEEAPKQDKGISPAAILRSMEQVQFCGCGEPVLFLTAVKDALHATDEGTVRLWLGDDRGDPYRWAMLYMLDTWELTEHGTSILGAWLTDAGRLLLSFLQLIKCSASRWDALETAGMNVERAGPLPETLDLAWLDEQVKRYNFDEDDDEEE